jgi:hypothetical protein
MALAQVVALDLDANNDFATINLETEKTILIVVCVRL